MGLLTASFVLGGTLLGSLPLSGTYLPDDPLFLTFRVMLLLLAASFAYFMIRWRRVVTRQNQELNAMNSNIQEQIILVNSGELINLVEKARTPLRFLGNNYSGGGAPEILERLKKIQANGGFTSYRENGGTSGVSGSGSSTENSSRTVLGAPEFSSRALVPTSPHSRFKD